MRKVPIIILLLAAGKFVLPFLLHHPAYELHRDEYLYFAQGQHLDFGFLENPPLIGLLGWISSLLGGSFFWIKFWPALFGAFTLLLACGIARQLGGGLYAQGITALGMLFSAYLRVHFLFQPNFLDIFWCAAAAYSFLRYANTEDKKYLYFTFLSLAMGWWSKYSIAFFGAGLLLSIVLTHYRALLRNPHFWFAAAVSLLLILPNLAWQYDHRWPLLHHMNELQRTQLRYLSRTDFLKEQLLMLLPVAFVWIGGLLWLMRQHRFRVLALTYVFLILFLMLGSGKGYYALGGYPMLLAAGGVWLEHIAERKALRYALVVWILLLSLPLVPLLMPMQAPQEMAESNRRYGLEKIGILKWEDQQEHALQQDFADMLGWKELTGKAEQLYESLPDTAKNETVIFGRHYGQASAMRYHARKENFKRKVYTDNGTFLLWIPDSFHFKNLVLIARGLPEKDDLVFQHFASWRVVDSVNNPLSRQHGDKIILFERASAQALQLANDGLQEMKSEFRR